MKTKIESITPELASEWLDKHNTINRPISEKTVNSYALDMKNGRWTLTHQGIAFDTDKNLQDGQHRLWAIVFSGCTIEMMVTRDVPVSVNIEGRELKTMDGIDRNRSRTTGQQMSLCHGIKNGNTVAAALRGIAKIISPMNARSRLSTANSLYFYELYGKDVESIIDVVGSTTWLRSSHVMAPISMYHHGEPVKAIEFCRQLASMENMSVAARTFRKFMESPQSKGNPEKAMRILARCLLAFHDSEPILKVHEDQKGTDFLIGMFPSLNKKIRDAITPCRKVALIKNKTKA